MNERHKFHGTSWEALEGRQLLNAANPTAALARLTQRAAMVAGMPSASSRPGGGIQAALGGRRGPLLTGLRGPGRYAPMPQGPINTDYNVVPPSLAITPSNAQLNVGPARPPVAPPPTSVPSTASTAYPVNTSIMDPTSGYIPTSPYGIRPRGTVSRTLATSIDLTSPTSSTSSSLGGGLATPTTPATKSDAASDRLMVLPGEAGATEPAFAPMPYDMLDGAVLSPEQVGRLKQATADLVASHTLGADATKDKAAIAAYQGVLDDLAMNVWTQLNVTTTESAAAMKQAAAAFADRYTGGADLATDQAAWKDFNAALAQFTRSIRNPNAPPMPEPDGPWNDGPWMTLPMFSGGAVKYLASGLLDGQPVNRDDLDGLKAAVDTFASTYTSGADKAKDMAAGEAMLNDIGKVMSRRWERLAPPEIRDLAISARPYGDPLAKPELASVARAPMSVALKKPPGALG